MRKEREKKRNKCQLTADSLDNSEQTVHRSGACYYWIGLDWMLYTQAGRDGREKFGRREKRANPNASSTNKEKRKTKNFMMLRHKVRKVKGKRSFHEKQVRYLFITCLV